MRVAVVGLGFVGAPLSATLAEAGVNVVGIDVDGEKISAIASGKSPLPGEEPGLPDLISRAVASGRLTATKDAEVIGEADAVAIAVETPLQEEDRSPDYRPLESALVTVGSKLPSGALISVESTLAPGTMEEFVRPTLEETSGMKALRDFQLVHAPERVASGRLLYNLVELDRILGANDPQSLERGLGLYRTFVKGDIHTTDWRTAEVVKTAENAYWDLQIAFANEMALVSEAYGVNAYEVRRLLNTCPGREMVLPGAGVGGACIPKDPWLLVTGARGASRLIPLARAVNDGMPAHVVQLILSGLGKIDRPVEGALVCVLGLSYKANVGDPRNSPGAAIARRLRELGAIVRLHDPFAPQNGSGRIYRDLDAALRGADCAVVVTDHDVYRSLDAPRLRSLMRDPPVVVDGRNLFQAASLGDRIVYRGLGKG